MEARGVLKIGHDVKFGVQLFAHRGVTVAPIDDTMLDFLRARRRLDRRGPRHGRSQQAHSSATRRLRSRRSQGPGATPSASRVSRSTRRPNTPPRTRTSTMRLWRALKPRLAAEHVATVYETLERPLVPVLARMERRGVAIDREMLSRLAGDFAQSMARLEDEISSDRRRAVQSRLAEAARRHPVRPDGAARRQADGDRRLVDDGERAGRPCRRGASSAGARARVAADLQAQVDLRRRAAGLRQSADRAGPHLLRARGDHHGAPVVVRAQSAEHPGAHRGGPQDPPRLRRPDRAQAHLGRLQPDRAASARPYRRHSGAEEGLRRRARHSRA